ncbi:unnamed protein product [Zymoseptoria tritici ST99CH_3D7]|uniref:Uncharacterized protein n=1 Tax=Zymoseptoria tritici (strain ST99CH_3D7) TaxID=1276538 RepID=A0A1X7S7B6_ZYMT9|nr:unnamed protein product [Zymoseptoria tritici ST99CH_3D7]
MSIFRPSASRPHLIALHLIRPGQALGPHYLIPEVPIDEAPCSPPIESLRHRPADAALRSTPIRTPLTGLAPGYQVLNNLPRTLSKFSSQCEGSETCGRPGAPSSQGR